MLNNDTLAKGASDYKRDSGKEFDKALAALIALAYKYSYMGADFLWDKVPALDDEANAILRDLSDTLAEKAKAVARAVMEESLTYYDLEESWDRGEDEWYVPVLTRFDQEGSHLKELLEIWIALAFVNGIGRSELRVLVSRHLANPFASPLWKGLRTDILKWGKGYAKNVREQMAVIGQNAIISASRYAEWQDAMSNGAYYYIRRRGSGFHCPECDSLCGYPIAITIPFEYVHSRCMCWPEYHFDDL